VDDLTGLYRAGRAEQRVKDWPIRAYFIAWHVGDDESQPESPEVMLLFELTVNRNEDVKRVLRVGQQRAIFAAAPANFSDGPDQVAGECRFDPGVDTFV
jgi:hypothetical protein